MPDKEKMPNSNPSFWIPGGILLLILCILIAELLKFADHHAKSELAKSLLKILTYLMRVVAVVGIGCVLTPFILAVFRRK
jgi:hypothetical protein